MHSTARVVIAAAAAVVGITIAGCVELTGQRITIHHDAAADRLVLYLAYDGIHETDTGAGAKGPRQIAEFAAAGDLMFVDWWGRVRMDALRGTVDADETLPAVRTLARATLRDVTVQSVGHYSSPCGRIGVLQRVEIRSVSTYVRQLNAAIDAAVLDESETGDGFLDVGEDMPMTRRLIEEAARRGHEWVRLQGGAVTLSVPLNRRELAAVRLEQAERLLSRRHRRRDRTLREGVLAFLDLSGQLTTTHAGGLTTFALGNADVSGTVRVPLGSEYTQGLEDLVREYAPVNVDDAVARHTLLAESPATSAALVEFLTLAPPEDRVRAVLGVATGGDAELREAADRWLEEFAVRWNRRDALPAAPTKPVHRSERLAEWAEWYAELLTFPMEP